VAQFATKRRPAIDFEPGGVFFWDETVFLSRRKHPETVGEVSSFPTNGGLVMQFIFELIWTQSRSRYLAAMGQPEAEH
jgi:hypothetical protein